jgi:hypothetical protein
MIVLMATLFTCSQRAAPDLRRSQFLRREHIPELGLDRARDISERRDGGLAEACEICLDADLRSDLRALTSDARERRSDADKKLQVRQLGAILKAGSKLRDLLKSDQGWDWLKEFEFEVLADGLDISLPKARGVIHDLEMKIEWGDDWSSNFGASRDLRDLIRKRSPFEWLAGTYLADDYRVCFGKEPTLQRATDGGLDGPFIRFVEQVLAEFDVKNGSRRFGREAIAKALKGRYAPQAEQRCWMTVEAAGSSTRGRKFEDGATIRTLRPKEIMTAVMDSRHCGSFPGSPSRVSGQVT